ncbi:ERF family protein [Streptomyces sp.]|uniref:ERF family protein n=1 Tax=Streptomyces sp. TaxID=1931 RepID=UPI002F91FE9C
MTEPKSLDEALCMLQADPPVLLKDKKGQVGNQKTKYADLVQVNAVVLSRLNALGVIYKTKPTLRAEDPKFVLAYSLKHVASGTEEAGEYPLKLSENPMQMGSAITYARRYVLLAITGIAAEDEDDDGQAAANRGTAQRSQQQRRRGSSSAPQEGAGVQRSAPPLPGEAVTDPQIKKVVAMFGTIGWNDRDDRLRATSAIVGRPLGSATELTKSEAHGLIEALEKVAAEPDPAGRLTDIVAKAREGASS